ncbi:Anthranilate 1,2-dioxygenase large subunit [Roseovarius litorisediminis]|uniref:Anthranilate 1,2-dioxygenase large subunit n=1 Tax=Roseovarius litorisediminis TaxID=1312363 RepID=A0A1Y5RZH1_9RHOB|nr:SRPBCC family protein [Roseovarius litorisediminis]SLN27768.1 Anthranilate 1,2-dioxygenase large subunit [Roseovarius litorisediminis]
MAKDHIDAVEALRGNTSLPFEQARAMPPEVYTSDAFTEQELEKIFRKEWFCVGRVDALARSGDYVTCDLAGQPIAVVRDAAGDLRAFSNVCLHRMSTLLHGRGNTKSIVCPYHAWTYNLDGSLRGAPAMSQNQGFCKDNYKLPKIRCEEWLGWVFVTLNPDSAPVAEQLAEVEGLIEDYDMAGYVESFYETHVWDTNWKVLAENFMESYHLPVCHAGTIGGMSKLEEVVCPEGRPAFNFHTFFKDGSLPIAQAHKDNDRLKGDRRRTSFLLVIYPSLMITLTPGYFWYLSLHPNGPGQVRMGFGGGMARDYAAEPEAQQHFTALRALLEDVNVEDRGCTEKVYRGLCSGLSRPGHLSHLERPNYDFAHYLINRIDAA